MKPLERGKRSKIGRAFPVTVGSVDVRGLLTRRAFVGGFCGGLAGVGAMLPIGSARAAYPDRPVRIVVPFLPGGVADLIARLLAPHLQHSLGQPFVVENHAGAAGRIGTAVVAKSDPDGHVLLMTTESSLVIAPHIGVPMNYEPLNDFAPISLLTRNTVILVVHPSVVTNTLNDYIALARDKPGQLFFASSGVGGPNHLAGEIFNRMAGVNIVHVPFPGTGGAIQAVVGNQVGAMWGFMAGLIPHIRSGAVRALAWRVTRRSSGSASRCSPPISGAAPRAPEPVTCSGRLRPRRGSSSAAAMPAGESKKPSGWRAAIPAASHSSTIPAPPENAFRLRTQPRAVSRPPF